METVVAHQLSVQVNANIKKTKVAGEWKRRVADHVLENNNKSP